MAQGSQVLPSGNGGSEQEEAEPKSQKGPEAVRPKHERRVSRDGDEMRNLTAFPARPDSVRSLNSKSEFETPKGPDALRPRHERRLSRDENDSRKSADSPLRPVGVRATVDSPLHHHNGINNSDSPKRVTRHGQGSDRSIEPSPLHPHHQARLGNKSSAASSPSWERKGASEGSHGLAPLTPGRSRLRSVTRGDETPDDSPTVPKFGDWDDNDPASGVGFTHIFERVREEKHSEAGKVPVMATETSYTNGQKRYGNDSPKVCGCFPWGGK